MSDTITSTRAGPDLHGPSIAAINALAGLWRDHAAQLPLELAYEGYAEALTVCVPSHNLGCDARVELVDELARWLGIGRPGLWSQTRYTVGDPDGWSVYTPVRGGSHG